MHSLEVYQTMQKALVQVQAEVNEGTWSTCGICSVLPSTAAYEHHDYTEVDKLFFELMKQWPDYSGCSVYPIGQSYEDGHWLYTNVPSYWTHSKESWMWAKTSPYGRKRRELLAYLISRCEDITGQVL